MLKQKDDKPVVAHRLSFEEVLTEELLDSIQPYRRKARANAGTENLNRAARECAASQNNLRGS
jgi:hypothetical protein